MAVPWTWAFDTPTLLDQADRIPFGGVRQGTVIAWPKTIKDGGGIRNQFHHFIDIVPTILEATGIPAPVMVDGVAQKPIEGVSMMYTFDKANANAPSTHTTQYFEMMADPRHLSRWLDREHQSHPAALGHSRSRQSRPREQRHMGALRPDQGLDPK